jgi:hypothetical protein
MVSQSYTEQITRDWKKVMAGVAIPMSITTPPAAALPTYAAQYSSGTPDVGYATFYKEPVGVAGRRAQSGTTGDFGRQLERFAANTEFNLSNLRAQIAELTMHVGELSRQVADDYAAPSESVAPQHPNSADDWAEIFSMTAEYGMDPIQGVALRASEVLKAGIDDALLISAARAAAAIDRSNAKALIEVARKKTRNLKIRERLADVIEDYSL